MAEISLVGQNSAGGIINGPGAVPWTIHDLPISLVGDGVSGHGTGAHAGPVMVTGSTWFDIDGIPVVVSGSLASCTHQADGDPWFDLPI